jgi:hypothetical protein
MTWVANSLWELGATALRAVNGKPRPRQGPKRLTPPGSETRGPAVKRKPAMQDRYDALVDEMKSAYGIRVRKWRKSSSGVAWTVRYINSGKIVKLIESPYPRGPMSCAIFLHEIGHHAIGLGVYKPRCLEEFVVWVWAIQKMREKGFNVTPAVEKRMERSMRYAVAKARRRGIQNLPAELHQYL